jgi:hypothetical protein
MKVKITLLILMLMLVLLTGCTKKAGTTDDEAGSVTPSVTESVTGSVTGSVTPDVVTTASIVDTEDAFLNAISAKGTWIIAITKDLTIDKDLLLEGEFKNGKKDDDGNDIIERKVALYAQDEDRTITARYILTAPKLTVTSPEASIQHGAFIGDLYVSAADFQLIDATVDGNVYFTTEEAQNTFKMDETSKVTGTQELKK